MTAAATLGGTHPVPLLDTCMGTGAHHLSLNLVSRLPPFHIRGCKSHSRQQLTSGNAASVSMVTAACWKRVKLLFDINSPSSKKKGTWRNRLSQCGLKFLITSQHPWQTVLCEPLRAAGVLSVQLPQLQLLYQQWADWSPQWFCFILVKVFASLKPLLSSFNIFHFSVGLVSK